MIGDWSLTSWNLLAWQRIQISGEISWGLSAGDFHDLGPSLFNYQSPIANEGELMPVKIIIPTPLRQYAEKKESMEVQAKTVAEALGAITSQYAGLRKHLYNDEGKLRSFVNIYVGDEDIRFLQKEQTALKENDVISIVPSIAGGKDLCCICS